MRFDKTGWTAGIGIVLFAIALLVIVVLDNKSKQQSVINWAHENGYQVVEIEQPIFNKGPFWWNSNDDDGVRVYRVKVRDRTERERIGWFRIGPFGGLDQKWDDGK